MLNGSGFFGGAIAQWRCAKTSTGVVNVVVLIYAMFICVDWIGRGQSISM